jgi:BirA family biotin operon repressor/biotin-[acetyl-CoA-carboxylase] ligase
MTAEELLRELADGDAHSGEALAGTFGVTRAAVWKHMDRLRAWELDIEAIPGSGYRLREGVDLIDAAALRQRLAAQTSRCIERLEVFTETDSTNAFVAAHAPARAGRLVVCAAEFQTAGRGRRGRQWNTPLGAGLCLSAGWRFAGTPPGLGALSLAAGVSVRRVLARMTGREIELKWPNDLVWQNAKLGGILVDLTAESQGDCTVIMGVGLNVAVPPRRLSRLCDWPGGAIDLRTMMKDHLPERTSLCAAVIDEWVSLLSRFSADGFEPFRREWERADHLRGQPVRVSDSQTEIEGVARGIDADGALLLTTADGDVRRIISGDVSVRSPP